LLSLLAGSTTCVLYGVGAALLYIRGRPTWPNRLLVAAAAFTAIWAATVAASEAELDIPLIVMNASRVCRDAGWYAVIIAFLHQNIGRSALWRRLLIGAGVSVAIELLFAVGHLSIDTGLGIRLTLPIVQFGISVFGLILLENLFRNLPRQSVWSLKLMGIGLAAVYAYDIALRIPQILGGQNIIAFVAAEPLAYVIVLPLFIVTAIRNDSLKLQLHSSRNVVFHSATVLFAGILLQGTAAAAYYVRNFGGTPVTALAIVLGFTALVTFIIAFSSHSVRSKIRGFINENFYSYKYDYRLEWKRFINTLSLDQNSSGPERVLRTISNLLDSPGGVLWVRRAGWQQFLPLAHWSLAESFGPIDSEDKLLKFFEDKEIDYIEVTSQSAHSAQLAWHGRFPSAWLAIPMRFKEELVAIALLQKPRASRRLDWEDSNLLRLTALELGAHLVHEHAAQLLSDSQQLTEFNKRVTFAVHDLKNTAGQLSLLAQNAERFGENPKFRADMVSTISHAANNLQQLIEKLKPTKAVNWKPGAPITTTNICELINRAARRPANALISLSLPSDYIPVGVCLQDSAALESALAHLISNAVEASPADGTVGLSVDQEENKVRVRVSDEGPGMSADFVANELFKPLHSTKLDGMGIGAYQAKTIVTELGGHLEVQSELGVGTTITLVLPGTQPTHHESLT
jgi:putative PEP-CTERM system histidine kinase